MKNSAYWHERFVELKKRLLIESDDYRTKELRHAFKKALREIDKEVLYWYHKLSEEGGWTLQGAKKVLEKDELYAFHMTLDEYIKKASGFTNEGTLKELKMASAKTHISRLEAIKC